MSQFLFQYHAVSPTTWVYLSSLLMVGLFFKFSRFWSVRNLDLIMLILLAPGLLLIHFGQVQRNALNAERGSVTGDGVTGDGVTGDGVTGDGAEVDGTEVDGIVNDISGEVPVSAATVDSDLKNDEVPIEIARFEYWGYTWLMLIGVLWLIRMLLDTRLTRRPLLSPNLSVGGMAFIGAALFIFLMANVVKSNVHDTRGDLLNRRIEQVLRFQQPDRGPGYAALNALPVGANKTIAILSHLAIVTGLVLIAYRHFGNITNGIGAATLYMMLPYTSQMTGRVDHFLPAACLIWAVFFYRRPLVAGVFVGAAFGCVYYPLFLLPLWVGFYWHRGWIRFLLGVAIALTAFTIALRFATGTDGFVSDLQRMFGILKPEMQDLEGFWNTRIGGWDPLFRLPVLAASAALSVSFLLWPAPKNLGVLISCSAAVMLASQFWHGFGGGLFIGWYLPLTLLMIFRPNLEDRVAQTMLAQAPIRKKRTVVAS